MRSGKTAAVLEVAREKLRTGCRLDLLLPSVDHVNYCLTELLHSGQIKLRPGQVFAGTFLSWARRILYFTHQHLQEIPPAEEWLRIYLLVKDNPLLATARLANQATLIQNIIAEFRQGGMMDVELSALIRHRPDPVLESGLKIYQQIRQQSREIGGVVPDESLLLAAETLSSNVPFEKREVLIIDGFYEYTGVQRRILKDLTRFYDEIICTITFANLPPYDYLVDLTGWLGKGRVIETGPSRTFDSVQKTISASLFNFSLLPEKPAEEKYVPVNTWLNQWSRVAIKIVQCPTRRSEIETAARTIKRWVADGLAPEKIGVIFRGGYDYLPRVRSVFREHNITVADPLEPLISTEPGRLLCDVVRLNRLNFRRTEFMDFLRSPAVRQHYNADDVQELEMQSVLWGLPFSSSEWLERSAAFLQYYQLLNEIPTAANNSHGVRPQTIADQQALHNLLGRIITDLSLPAREALSSYVTYLNNLLNLFLPGHPASSALRQCRQILGRLRRLFPSDRQMTLPELEQILTNFLTTMEAQNEKSKSPGLYCDKLMSARGRRFEGLVLLGLVDGEFPGGQEENYLFGNALREHLNNQAGEKIFGPTGANIAEEKFLFYLVLHNFERHLLVTYPELDQGGKAIPRSPFIEDLLQCTTAGREAGQVSFEFVPTAQVLPESRNLVSQRDVEAYLFNYSSIERTSALATLIDPDVQESIAIRLGIETRRQRSVADGWSGQLGMQECGQKIIPLTLTETAIQRYIDCPFAFLCQAIWRIDTPRAAALDLDAQSEGNLLHKTLEKFVNLFKAQSALSWTEYLADPTGATVTATLQFIADEYRDYYHHLPELLWQEQLRRQRQGLLQFIDEEQKYAALGYTPHLIEEKLAVSDPETCLYNTELQKVLTLCGKIDRVDLDPIAGRFLVIDYKRSDSNITNIIGGALSGEQIQIPLYLILAGSKLAPYHPGGGCYYDFKHGRRTRGFQVERKIGRSSLATPAEVQQILQVTRQHLRQLQEAMFAGRFYVRPLKTQTCTTRCGYFDLCRIEPEHLQNYNSSR